MAMHVSMSIIQRDPRGHVRCLGQRVLLIQLDLDLLPNLLLVLLDHTVQRALDGSKVLLPRPHGQPLLARQRERRLQHQALAQLAVLLVPTARPFLLQPLPRLLEQLVQQLLARGQHAQAGAVRQRRARDLLAHGGLLELVLELLVEPGRLLAHQLRLLDGELLVGLDLDLARLLERLLADEHGHLLQLRGHLCGRAKTCEVSQWVKANGQDQSVPGRLTLLEPSWRCGMAIC